MHKKHGHLKAFELLILLSLFTFAYFIFKSNHFLLFRLFIESTGYMGTFVSGFFYSYSFSAPIATAMLLVLAKQQNIIFAGIVGGIGALLSDLLIFTFIRKTFYAEIHRIYRKQFFDGHRKKPHSTIRKIILGIIASILIASPLPTEIGVSLMAMLKFVSARRFALIAYLLHTAGIFIILAIGHSI